MDGAVNCDRGLSSERAGPITITEQGSFFVGGRQVQAAGRFDPTRARATLSESSVDEGQTFWIDQMYVQYQIPVNARKHPLILVHGGCGTGRVWETTPDGREGYQTLMLRHGYPVYIVDFPHRGRSGFPSFNGPFGMLSGSPIVPNVTSFAGIEYARSRWRVGQGYSEPFALQQFPVEAVDQFIQHLVPQVSDDAATISDALVQLVNRIGPAILVTHSQSGLFGWLAAARCPLVQGVVAYEPGFAFPDDAMPERIPLYQGSEPAGTPIGPDLFGALARIPIQVVYGDNIPKEPIADLLADARRAQVVASAKFADAINRRGGNASVLHLPRVGLRGNSHFMFLDKNNIDVAGQLIRFLNHNGLDKD